MNRLWTNLIPQRNHLRISAKIELSQIAEAVAFMTFNNSKARIFWWIVNVLLLLDRRSEIRRLLQQSRIVPQAKRWKQTFETENQKVVSSYSVMDANWLHLVRSKYGKPTQKCNYFIVASLQLGEKTFWNQNPFWIRTQPARPILTWS